MFYLNKPGASVYPETRLHRLIYITLFEGFYFHREGDESVFISLKAVVKPEISSMVEEGLIVDAYLK